MHTLAWWFVALLVTAVVKLVILPYTRGPASGEGGPAPEPGQQRQRPRPIARTIPGMIRGAPFGHAAS